MKAKIGLRYRFLYWLSDRVFKTPEGEIMPPAMRFIFHLLFPLHWLYARQSEVKYEPVHDTYTIRGVKISGAYIQLLQGAFRSGELFRFHHNDLFGVTIERVSIDQLIQEEITTDATN